MGALYTYSCPVGMHVCPPRGTKAQEITGHGGQCLFCAVDYAGRDEISPAQAKAMRVAIGAGRLFIHLQGCTILTRLEIIQFHPLYPKRARNSVNAIDNFNQTSTE
jgi:hypothetical protein